jgi:hypothetical protein
MARTASGKTAHETRLWPCYQYHLELAARLSIRMGWGEKLVGGETKDGFAFIPHTAKDSRLEELQSVAQMIGITHPGFSPTTIADAILKLAGK